MFVHICFEIHGFAGCSMVLICSTDGTLPLTFTLPSTTSAGVVITPNAMICFRSVTFSSSYWMSSICAAFSVAIVSALHLAQPVPRIWIFMLGCLSLVFASGKKIVLFAWFT